MAELCVSHLSFAGNVEVFSRAPIPKIRRPAHTHALDGLFGKKPEKTPNPYFLFCTKRRTELQCENPKIPSREVTKMLASEWRQMTEAKKAEYFSKYQETMEKARDYKTNDSIGRRELVIQIPTPNGGLISMPAWYDIR
jgi:hypothetical protein